LPLSDAPPTSVGMIRWNPFAPRTPFVAIVRLQGTITSTGRGLSDRALAQSVEKAFSRGKPAAVALEINSPGGSPVQSSLIAARLRRLSEDKGIPVFAFVEDVAASGGYWLACAADEIFVDATSIVGSIGVITAGFGLQDLIAHYGIERRVHTSGTSKSMLDPFRAEKPEDVARLETWLTDIHGTFIDHVKSRRGARLSDAADLFTGEIWVGQKAADVGLVDGIGHLVPVMKARFGDKVRFRRYGVKKPFLSRFGLSLSSGAVAAADAHLAERADFARFGIR